MAEQHIRDGNINWESLLLLITVAKVEEEQYSSTGLFQLLKEIIRDLMTSGLTEKREREVLGAFILARHCCLISPQNFERYEKWYVGIFGNENTSPAKTPEALIFLAAVLSACVPNEPVCFLQVHATYWPFVLPGMRSIWSDYVGLSKARISEYNEIEQAMEYEPNPNNPVKAPIPDRVNLTYNFLITDLSCFRYNTTLKGSSSLSTPDRKYQKQSQRCSCSGSHITMNNFYPPYSGNRE